MEAVNITDLTGNQTGGCIADTWNAEKIWTQLIHISLDLCIITFDTASNMLHFLNGIHQLKGIVGLGNTDGVFGGSDQQLRRTLASAVQERCDLVHMRSCKSFGVP